MRGYSKFIILFLLLGFCACNKPVETSNGNPSQSTVPTTILISDVTPTVQPIENIQPREDEIPLTSACFSSSVMIDYLKSEVDLDQNGYLSYEERENVTEIFFDPLEIAAIEEEFDGFECFPDLAYVVLPKCKKAVFRNCLSLIAVSGNETDAYGELIFENCPNLISCGTLFHAARNLSVKDCEALRYVYCYDAIMPGEDGDTWTFEGIKELEVFGRAENLPERIVADAGEVTLVSYDGNEDTNLWNEDFTITEDGTLLIGGKARIDWLNKESYADAVRPMSKQLERMITEQNILSKKSGEINRISLLSYSLKNGVAYAVEVGDNIFVIEVSPDGTCMAYDSFREWKEEKQGIIPIDIYHFGSEAFCKYIRMYIDENQDGVLSKEERLAVTKIVLADSEEYSYWEKSDVVRGLELFPNLTILCTDNVDNLILQNHPSLEYYGTGESHLDRIYVENCSRLKEIGFSLVYGKSNVYVKKCQAFERLVNTDMGIEDAVELVRTPWEPKTRYQFFMRKVTIDAEPYFQKARIESEPWKHLLSDKEIIDHDDNNGYYILRAEKVTPMELTELQKEFRAFQGVVCGDFVVLYQREESEEFVEVGHLKNVCVEIKLNWDDTVEVQKIQKREPVRNAETKPTPVPTDAPTCTLTPMPTGMPERMVKLYDDTVDLIPISEEYFSDEKFREILSEMADTDKDGMLSRKERDAVLHLGEDEYGKTMIFDIHRGDYVLDGLEWFQNLEELHFDGESVVTIYLDHHPSIVAICGHSIWDEITVFANACERLETISVGEGYIKAVIIDCEQMKDLQVCEGSVKSLCCKNTPSLQLTAWVEHCSLGTEAGLYPWDIDDRGRITMWKTMDSDGTEQFYSKEGIVGGRFELVGDNQFKYWCNIEWRGWGDLKLNLSELKTRLIEENEVCLRQMLEESVQISTDVSVIFFSPAKSSLYRVESWPTNGWDDPEDDRTSLHYFIVDGTEFFSYDSLDEVYAAASGMDDLKDVTLQETIGKFFGQ